MQIYSVSILDYDTWLINTVRIRAWSRRGAARIARKLYGSRVGIRSIDRA